MAKVITQEKLDFNNAVEIAALRIHQGPLMEFFMNTEFGVIGFEIYKEKVIKPNSYTRRVEAYRWKTAPATNFVGANRNKKVDFYVELHVHCDIFGNKITQHIDLTRVEVARGLVTCILYSLDPNRGKLSSILPIYEEEEMNLLVYMWNKSTPHSMVTDREIASEMILSRYPSIISRKIETEKREVISLTTEKYEHYETTLLHFNETCVPSIWSEYGNWILMGNLFYGTLMAVFMRKNNHVSYGFNDSLYAYLNDRRFAMAILDKFPGSGQVSPYYLIKKMIRKGVKLIDKHIMIEQFIAGDIDEEFQPPAVVEKNQDTEPQKKDGMKVTAEPIKKEGSAGKRKESKDKTKTK